MKLIGLDIGTSFIKGAILDMAARSIRHVRRVPCPPRIETGSPLLHEVAPGALAGLCRDLLAELAGLEPECAGVVVCSQMHGMVLADQDGRALSNAITWQDQRTLQAHPSGAGMYFDAALARLAEEEVQAL